MELTTLALTHTINDITDYNYTYILLGILGRLNTPNGNL